MLIKNLRRELWPLLKLAGPTSLTQLGMMFMGIVDTYMVGKIGPVSIGAVAVGNAVFYAIAVFGMGVLTGLDFLVSFSHGKKSQEESNFWFFQGIYLAGLLALFAFPLLFSSTWIFDLVGMDPQVSVQAKPFLRASSFGIIPFMLFFACRQFLQAQNKVLFFTVLFLFSNLLNYFLNWLWVFGNWGFPAMGVEGSAWATNVSRAIWLLAVLLYILFCNKKYKWGLEKAPKKFDLVGFRRLLKIGGPAGFQYLFEVGVFALSTTLAGRLGATQLAAHQIVLNVASMTFMVPLGISMAASVRVGQELGAGNPDRSRYAGWTSLGLGASFMALSALVLSLFRNEILGLFTTDAEVIALGSVLIVMAAGFQIADGIQVVGGGALRGLSNTKTSMVANFVGYWIVAFPLGVYLTFFAGWQVKGLWVGLTTGLIVVAALMLWAWRYETTNLLKRR